MAPSAPSSRIGLGLLPSARAKGYGTDVIAVLRSAERNGSVREGV
ncbi:hypothetical protein [Glaciibacter superstes]|nr:hypothetical protein [Glaciibacter superstes]